MKNYGKIGQMTLFLILVISHTFVSAHANGEVDTPPLDIINSLLVPVSTSITLLITAIGGWLSLREYRLKIKAEIRLKESAELESDIKLLKLITEVIDIAHGRGGTHVSEKAIEKILSPEIFTKLGESINLAELLQDIIIRIPVGFAAQDAAISAVWALGKKHPVITPVAIQALESINLFKSEVAAGYLEDLKTTYGDKILAATEEWRRKEERELAIARGERRQGE